MTTGAALRHLFLASSHLLMAAQTLPVIGTKQGGNALLRLFPRRMTGAAKREGGSFLNRAEIVFCDGAGVMLGARILGYHIPQRITYADWTWQLAEFAEAQDLVLVVPAEGTRRLASTWRSGFYHIARLAGVPVVLGYLDYARKRGGLGPEIRPTGDPRADMDRIRAFYADKTGRYPAQFTEPRLEDELTPP